MTPKDNSPESYFSISMDLIQVDTPLLYDLYVNASSNQSRLNFIRIFPKQEILSKEDIASFRKKYPRLYVPESDRDKYLQSLVRSSNYTAEQKSSAIKDSAIQYLDHLFDQNKEFTTEVLNDAIAGCRNTVESMVEVISDFDIQQLQEHISLLSFHDFYTYDHSINVSMYCISILKILQPNASSGALITAGLGGMLHDVGKIKIPTTILNKPDKLDSNELMIMQTHPERGSTLLSGEKVVLPEEVDAESVLRVILEHHENFDGSGYPSKLQGNSIHLLARITAIADFFDAITTKRSYHEPLSIAEAVALMRTTAGKKLDPNLFALFAKHVGNIAEQAPRTQFVIDEDFDACMPHRELPLTQRSADIQSTPEQQDFGGIREASPAKRKPQAKPSKKPIKVTVSEKHRKKRKQ